MTKNTKICPLKDLSTLLKATMARFAAFNINSMDMKITSGLRRNTTPATPMENRIAERMM